MKRKAKTPEPHSPSVLPFQSNINFNVIDDKGKTKIDYTKIYNRVYSLLASGAQLSSYQLCKDARTGDARSVIRLLRKRGTVISDYWKVENGHRYKVYFIKSL